MIDKFIDESGTHKKTGHATTAIVSIQIEHQIKSILTDLDISSFHWAEQGWKIKEKFLIAVTKLSFKGVSIKKIKAVRNEASHPGIQLADAIAGLVRYCYDNPQEKDSNRLFKKLKKEKKLIGQFLLEAQP